MNALSLYNIGIIVLLFLSCSPSLPKLDEALLAEAG